jgi:hypothetical protein
MIMIIIIIIIQNAVSGKVALFSEDIQIETFALWHDRSPRGVRVRGERVVVGKWG